MEKHNNKKIAIILLSIFVILFLFVTIFLSVVLNSFSLGVNINDSLNHKYFNVMSSLDNISEVNPLYVDLAMIASHGAATYNLVKGGEIDNKTKNTTLGKFYPIIKGIQYRFAKTQVHNIYDQLMQGARLIQIKVANNSNTWYGTHTSFGSMLDVYILDVLKFLEYCDKNNCAEIVSLIIYPTYIDDNHNIKDLLDYIYSIKYNNKCILDYIYYPSFSSASDFYETETFNKFRYNDLTLGGTKPGILLMDTSYFLPEEKWHAYYIGEYNTFSYKISSETTDYSWYDRANRKLLINDIEKEYERLKGFGKSNKLGVLQAHASFTFKSFNDAMSVINDWSLIKIASKLNSEIVNDVNRFNRWLTVMPIVQVDYVTSTYDDFNNKINKLIKEYNQKLINDVFQEY